MPNCSPAAMGRPGTSPADRGLALSVLVVAAGQLRFIPDDAIATIAHPVIQR